MNEEMYCEHYRIERPVAYSNQQQYQQTVMALFNMEDCFDDQLFNKGIDFIREKTFSNTDFSSLYLFAGKKLLFNEDIESGLVLMHCYELLPDFHALIMHHLIEPFMAVREMKEYEKLQLAIEEMSGPADPGIS